MVKRNKSPAGFVSPQMFVKSLCVELDVKVEGTYNVFFPSAFSGASPAYESQDRSSKEEEEIRRDYKEPNRQLERFEQSER